MYQAIHAYSHVHVVLYGSGSTAAGKHQAKRREQLQVVLNNASLLILLAPAAVLVTISILFA